MGTYLLPGVTHGALKEMRVSRRDRRHLHHRMEPCQAVPSRARLCQAVPNSHLRSTLPRASLHPPAAPQTCWSLLPLLSGGEKSIKKTACPATKCAHSTPEPPQTTLSPSPGVPRLTHAVPVLAFVSSTSLAAGHPLGQRDPGGSSHDPPNPPGSRRDPGLGARAPGLRSQLGEEGERSEEPRLGTGWGKGRS